MAIYIIGVDGGQSSTIAVVADRDGRVLGVGTGGPANHITEPEGPARCRHSVETATTHALATAGLGHASVGHIALGMTGFVSSQRSIVKEAVGKALGATPHSLYPDFVTAHHAATTGQPGATVIGGTGSSAYGEDGTGKGVQRGGWGYLLGDEGSAYWIALQALQAATLAFDGRGPKTTLSTALPQRLGLGDFHELRDWIYGAATRSSIARLAMDVDQAAAAGDPVARSILMAGGRALARLAVAVLEPLKLGDAPHGVVSYTGGAFNSPMVKEAFSKEVSAQTSASVRPPALPQVGGALLLAYRALGWKITDKHIRTLKQEFIEKRVHLR